MEERNDELFVLIKHKKYRDEVIGSSTTYRTITRMFKSKIEYKNYYNSDTKYSISYCHISETLNYEKDYSKDTISITYYQDYTIRCYDKDMMCIYNTTS